MSHYRDWSVWVLSGLLFLCAMPVLADAAPSPIRLSGYGTLAYSWENNPQLAPVRDMAQRPQGPFAFSADETWLMDSRLGLQAAYRHSPRLGALVQLLLHDQIRQEADGTVELAYLDLQPAEQLRLRVGRIGFDGYLMSDHRNLGYAYAWMRPPTEFYGWMPMFGLDGADLTHAWSADGVHWRARAQVGSTKKWFPMGKTDFQFHGDSLWSLSLQREEGPWRWKTGVSGFTSSAEVPSLAPLHTGLQALAAVPIPAIAREAAMLRHEMRFGDVSMRYATLGIAYDNGTWLVQTELGRNWAESAMTPAGSSAYFVIGRRLGAWTPYLMLGTSRPQEEALAPLNDWSVIGQRAFQTTAYQVVNSVRADQTTLAIGTRWDAYPRVALKFQWENTRIAPMGYALWPRSPDVFYRSTQVNLFTVGMDLLF